MEKMVISDQQYGKLLPFVKDEKVTDINWNGNELWIDNVETGRYCSDVKLSPEFVNQFSAHVAKEYKESFDEDHPVIKVYLGNFCIAFVHESKTGIGTTIDIRKSPNKIR